MLITINVTDKENYLFRLFQKLWAQSNVECQICLDRISNDGVVAVTDYYTLNLEKMFHASCLKRWKQSNTKDPFNRNVKFYFNFPPQHYEECVSLLNIIKGFIGDQHVDKLYASEYERVHNEPVLDCELDFAKLLSY
ncbi:hypothetical protein [Urbanus proteus nucleopolyhedrovirus]|uniref:Ac53 n=1 Tax=Urbanus proteus nucleopolyhedrovirus TaxID=1675866 RepID=A0A162GTT0_9ABAC|nr:hypothetical protein [Urbanus proteus nucleopolyhedrovirus]AKR17293.1 hypothetical protein [Urbanus proteus nucleopolyhedrovirus]